MPESTINYSKSKLSKAVKRSALLSKELLKKMRKWRKTSWHKKSYVFLKSALWKLWEIN